MSGFLKYAQADPDHVAIVDPDGTEHRAGRDVLGRANQVVARPARGGSRGPATRSRRCSPTVEPDAAHLARAVGLLVLRPDQLPPERARDRVHPRGLRGEGIREPRALRRARRRGSRRSGHRARYAPHTARCPFRSLRRDRRLRATTASEDRKTGASMHLHVGHHRPAQGRAPPAAGSTPTHRRDLHVLLLDLRHPAARRATCTS